MKLLPHFNYTVTTPIQTGLDIYYKPSSYRSLIPTSPTEGFNHCVCIHKISGEITSYKNSKYNLKKTCYQVILVTVLRIEIYIWSTIH